MRAQYRVEDREVEVDEAGIAQIQALTRPLLAEAHRALSALGVQHWLAYGTLLGAVREGDLIPWDVDADLWVRGEDIDRIERELPALLGPEYELCSSRSDPTYEYLFPRVARRGVHHCYLRVDLFPLDPAPRGGPARRARTRVLRLLHQVHYVKYADPALRPHLSARERWVIRIGRVIAAPVPGRLIRRLARSVRARGGSAALASSCGSYGGREYLDGDWFDDTVAMPVAGASLPAPAGWDAALTRLYGDYRTPVDAQRQQVEKTVATLTVVEPLRALGALGEGA